MDLTETTEIMGGRADYFDLWFIDKFDGHTIIVGHEFSDDDINNPMVPELVGRFEYYRQFVCIGGWSRLSMNRNWDWEWI